MLNKEYEILKPFADKPWQKFTFKQVIIISKKKSKSYVFKTLKKFTKERILKEKKVGNAILYSINFDSMKALFYVGFVSEYIGFNKKNIPLKDLEKISSKIPSEFYILIVTGSYARGTQTKNSDLDLAIICDSLNPNEVYSELRYDCEMNIPKIHLYVFTKEQFLKMLLDKKPNYGKETSKNALILSGGKEYLRIIKEAIKNGFNG